MAIQEALESREVFATCPHDCPDSCAMVATVEKDRVTGVRGRRDHPFTRGTLCVKVKNYQDRVHSPDRVLHPQRRIGAKGEGRFERITWAEALAAVRDRFRAVIDEFGAEAILPCSYIGQQGFVHGLNSGDAFFNRLGATIMERTLCASAANSASVMTTGVSAGVDPLSFAHSRYIVIWGCNTISTHMHQWPMIAEAQRAGAKVVVVDPVRSRTAAKADWHVRIRPGTDAALALGMMNVIIAEDLIDAGYVADHTVGFDALRERAAQYPPDRVAAITALPADDVRRLAHEYATTQPSVIRVGVAVERHRSGGQAVRALVSLPALVGAWRHVGGGVLVSGAMFKCRWSAWSEYGKQVDSDSQCKDTGVVGYEVLSGMKSVHSNQVEDRKWSFYCCTSTRFCPRQCRWSNYINNWGGYMHYIAPHIRVFTGVKSDYDPMKK